MEVTDFIVSRSRRNAICYWQFQSERETMNRVPFSF